MKISRGEGYEIRPYVNEEGLTKLFGFADDIVLCSTLEMAVKISEAANEAEENPEKISDFRNVIYGSLDIDTPRFDAH